jgi:sulfoxide reductase heme-binding subunit YedZ
LVKAMFGSRTFLWIIVGVPLAVQIGRYLGGAVYYGEFLHWTGEWATRLLILALAVTPLRLAAPNARWSRWLVSRRRDLGIVTCLYALGHTIAYLAYQSEFQAVLKDMLDPGMATGWFAMIVFSLLALTSNDYSVRGLGRRWKSLHRFVYAGAVLTLAHWILTAFDPTAGYVHLAVLGALLIPRLWTARGTV